MCNPLVFQIVSLAVTAAQAKQQGDQQQKLYDYQAAQGQADAIASREESVIAADKTRKAGRYTQGEARAALSASGVEVGAGTPVKIVQQIASNVEQDAQQQLISGERKATSLEQESKLNTLAGKNAAQAGYQRAGGTLVEGAYQIGKGWKTASRPGSATGAGSAAVTIGGG